jgi:hypothetical protein
MVQVGEPKFLSVFLKSSEVMVLPPAMHPQAVFTLSVINHNSDSKWVTKGVACPQPCDCLCTCTNNQVKSIRARVKQGPCGHWKPPGIPAYMAILSPNHAYLYLLTPTSKLKLCCHMMPLSTCLSVEQMLQCLLSRAAGRCLASIYPLRP